MRKLAPLTALLLAGCGAATATQSNAIYNNGTWLSQDDAGTLDNTAAADAAPLGNDTMMDDADSNRMGGFSIAAVVAAEARAQGQWSAYLRCLHTGVSLYSRTTEPARDVVRAAWGLCHASRQDYLWAVEEQMRAGGQPDVYGSAERYVHHSEEGLDDELLSEVMSSRIERTMRPAARPFTRR